jgi:hypothetical protein
MDGKVGYNTRTMRFLLLSVSTPVLIALIVGGGALLSAAATFLVRRRIPEEEHIANNEVAGFILAAVGAVYGVLLAFMVLVVWQAYEDANRTVEQEANILVDIYRLGQAVPDPYGAQLRERAVEYARHVIDDEWDKMQTGDESDLVHNTVEEFWNVHRALDADSALTGNHDGQLFDALQELGNERRIRLLDSRLDLPGLMWMLLIGGGVVTIGFTLFLRAPNWLPHLLMAAMFGGLVAFVLLLIVELDNPFAGDIRIQPLAFQQALVLFERLRGN